MSSNKSVPVPTPDEVGHFYDHLTRFTAAIGDNLHFGYWDEPDGEVSPNEAADRLTDILIDKLKIGPESHLLDLGCGVGGPGVRIARITGAQVTGISVSEEQVKLANSLAESTGLRERVVFQQANAMEINFPPQSFDAVIAIESIIHMPDRGQVLANIGRLLQPGGRLVLTDIFERAPISATKRSVMDPIINNFLMSTLVRVEDYPPLLRDAGLWFEEILDITEHSVPKSLARMSELADEWGVPLNGEVAERSDITKLLEQVNVPEFGYLILVAKRATTL
jgi:cyclopropane fatty-acyl-phospholipid synthase-like methyltransferase